ELVPAKTDNSFTTAAQTDTKQPENSSIIVAVPPAQDPLSASSAFTAVNAFAGFSEDPFALFLGPPAIPAKIARSQEGGLDQETGRNSGGGSAGSGGTTAIGGSPLVESLPPIVAGADLPLSAATSSAVVLNAPATSVGSVPATAATPAGASQGSGHANKH